MLSVAPSGWKRPLEIKYTYSNTLSRVVSEYIWFLGPISKTLGVVACFFYTFSSTFRRETPFENEIYIAKYPGLCSFRVYMVLGVYLQNPRSGCLIFPIALVAPSGGRCPLEMKYTFLSTLHHVGSEYIWLLGSVSKTLGVVACFFPKPSVAPSGGSRPLEIKYTFPNTLSHVVSEYIWLWGSISKALGGIR